MKGANYTQYLTQTPYKPTTALRKIASLRKPTKIIQGGQGAGKTVSILILLINHALHNRDKEITVLQAELSKMKKTVVLDFKKIMKSYGLFNNFRWNKTDSIYTFPNGSYLEFIGMDKADIGKGFRRDVIYFNELNKGGITLDAYMQFASRAGMVFADFNPDMRFWLHDEIIPEKDTDFIILTHEDNEFLPDKERSEIFKYKEKGFFDPDAKELFSQDNIKSKYWSNKWLVYGLGKPGKLEGIIFDNWEILERIPPNAAYQGSGLDFGFSVDPTTIMDNYRYNQKRIWDEHLYMTGLVNPEIARYAKQGFNRLICADSAEPKSIEEIRRYGIRILGADKGKDSINFGIDLLQQEKFYVTKRSVHLIEELESYTWATDRNGNFTGSPIDNYNHCIDAMRYFAMMKMKTGSGRYAVR